MENTNQIVLEFAKQMQTELNNNSHKGDWKEWKNVSEMLEELEYHKSKLIIELRKDNSHDKVKELIADCANFLMFIGNAGKLYNQCK